MVYDPPLAFANRDARVRPIILNPFPPSIHRIKRIDIQYAG